MDPNYTPNAEYTSNTGYYDSNRNYGTGAQPPQSYRARAEDDPGKVLGIISLVATLSTFLGFNVIGPIVGIITGHMARKNSRSAGFADNEMGKWGFILGIVFISLAALGGLLGLTFAGVAGLAGILGA
ncbi:MAG: DUF4190 domain-containing protein [Brevibacterium sp.]|uniref:DUF4190 domain-containing protein n=1 Tax=Brevibacterium sandarakinum TaxID=629680 RepID=UPI002654DFD8|nr:DUF4190 domain-containing protein [Brevibacterium sandarakinum]MDN5586545.1 DUF4190 domain-containing protein [Brevibacterium sp.]MDN5658157.1 DUF4190 domain-containing protein [Brevibacterium sandarakinum]